MYRVGDSFAVDIQVFTTQCLSASLRANQSAKMLQSLAIFSGFITVVLYLFHYLVHYSKKGKLIDKIPGPYPWPIIGNTIEYLVPTDQLWNVARTINKKYYPINRLWTPIMPIVNVYHPNDIEVVLTSSKNIDKSFLYKFLHPWLGTGLLTSTGRKWHQRRRILTPAFHFSVLQQFVDIFIEQSDKLVESLCPDEEEVIENLVSLLHKYTLSTVCETAMGSTSRLNKEVLEEYRSCVSTIGDVGLHRLLRPWWHSDWMFRWSKKFLEQCRALKVLHRFSTNIIKERKQYHKDTGGQFLKSLGSDESVYGFDEDYVNGKRRLAMLDLLISASQREGTINDEGIREEVDTFVFEAHDTTAMAICFTLMLLAENKEIQDKARAEVDEVFEERKGEKLSIREFQRLSYMERCIKESLRLFPSVPFISRHVSEDIQLSKYIIPAGTMAHIYISEVHRDPNFWEHPNTFDPDRFLPERTQGRHPFAYVPFSAGPRNCIGQKFAMLELKALISKVLHKFYLEPIDLSTQVRIMPDLVMRPFDPIRIKLVRRSYND